MADTATRPNRAEQTRRERRMKPGDVALSGIKLGLDEEKLDRVTFAYRWVKDAMGRVGQMIKRDWDPVDEPIKADSVGAGTIPTAVGGVGENGQPYGMVLMKKYKDWYDADQKVKRKPLDEIEAAIKRGTAHEKSGEQELNGVTYTPGTNSISRG